MRAPVSHMCNTARSAIVDSRDSVHVATTEDDLAIRVSRAFWRMNWTFLTRQPRTIIRHYGYEYRTQTYELLWLQ